MLLDFKNDGKYFPNLDVNDCCRAKEAFYGDLVQSLPAILCGSYMALNVYVRAGVDSNLKPKSVNPRREKDKGKVILKTLFVMYHTAVSQITIFVVVLVFAHACIDSGTVGFIWHSISIDGSTSMD